MPSERGSAGPSAGTPQDSTVRRQPPALQPQGWAAPPQGASTPGEWQQPPAGQWQPAASAPQTGMGTTAKAVIVAVALFFLLSVLPIVMLLLFSGQISTVLTDIGNQLASPTP